MYLQEPQWGWSWNQGTWGGSGKYLSMNCFNQFNKPTKVLVSDYMLSSLEMCSHRLILNYGRLFRDGNLNWICLECKYILGQIHRSGKKSGEKEKGKDTQQVRGTLVRLELEPCLCIPAIWHMAACSPTELNWSLPFTSFIHAHLLQLCTILNLNTKTKSFICGKLSLSILVFD